MEPLDLTVYLPQPLEPERSFSDFPRLPPYISRFWYCQPVWIYERPKEAFAGAGRRVHSPRVRKQPKADYTIQFWADTGASNSDSHGRRIFTATTTIEY